MFFFILVDTESKSVVANTDSAAEQGNNIYILVLYAPTRPHTISTVHRLQADSMIWSITLRLYNFNSFGTQITLRNKVPDVLHRPLLTSFIGNLEENETEAKIKHTQKKEKKRKTRQGFSCSHHSQAP